MSWVARPAPVSWTILSKLFQVMKSLTWLVFNSLMTNVTHLLVTLVTPMYDIRRVGGSVYQSAASVAFVIGSEISPVVVDLHRHQNAS